MITAAYRGGYDGRPGWWLSLRYDEDLVAKLKGEIPSADRRWDPKRGAWFVALEHEATILRILPNFEAFLKQGQLL